MATGLEAALHRHHEGMAYRAHYLVFVSNHVDPVLLPHQCLVDDLQGAEVAVTEPPGQINTGEASISNASFDLKIAEATRNGHLPHGFEFDELEYGNVLALPDVVVLQHIPVGRAEAGDLPKAIGFFFACIV